MFRKFRNGWSQPNEFAWFWRPTPSLSSSSPKRPGSFIEKNTLKRSILNLGCFMGHTLRYSWPWLAGKSIPKLNGASNSWESHLSNCGGSSTIFPLKHQFEWIFQPCLPIIPIFHGSVFSTVPGTISQRYVRYVPAAAWVTSRCRWVIFCGL